MEYLSFDLECSDGSHVCEFGYVLFDDDFTLIEKKCVLIDPEAPFRLRGRKESKDLELAFTQREYRAAPKFPSVYPKIKELLEKEDRVIFGFALRNDVGFLHTACERYGLAELKFSFYDFQKLYRGYTGSKNNASVKTFVEELEIDDLTLHKSDDDAHAVMLGLKKICEKESLTLTEAVDFMMKKARLLKKELSEEQILSIPDKLKTGNRTAQKEYLYYFIRRVKRKKKIACEALFGKKVCVSSEFERTRYNEFLSLVELLFRADAVYTNKAGECDVFVLASDDAEEDGRYE